VLEFGREPRITVYMLKDTSAAVSAIGLLLVAAVALVPRVTLALMFPEAEGDARIYLRVAHNILENGCVSLSSPESAECVPHWGGNQLPGYPAFVAASIRVLPMILDERISVGIMQSIVAAAVIVRMVQVVGRVSNDSRVAIAAGLLLAISPAHIAWSRWTLTESLATSMAIWFFAEILASMHKGRMHIALLSVVLGGSIFVRYDMILLVLPLLVAAFWTGEVRRSCIALLCIAVLSALPMGAWVSRSVGVGLPFPPPTLVMDGGQQMRTPEGFTKWVNTWIHNQYELQTTLWPAVTRQYADIDVPDRVFGSEEERRLTMLLLDQLRPHAGREFPLSIDEQFADLAERRRAEDPFGIWLLNPAIRAAWLWLNPLTSLGWPANPGIVSRQFATHLEGGLTALLIAVKAEPVTVFGKAVNSVYRFGLLIVLLYLVARYFRRAPHWHLVIAALALLHALGRTAFFAYSPWTGPETRYMVEAFPPIEIAVVLLMHARSQERESKNLPASE